MALFRASFRPDVTATPVRRRPSLDFSLTGLVYCSMMMFMGLAAINSQANLLFGVFGLMIGILLASVLVSRKVLKGLKVRRVLPSRATVGFPMGATYQFTNPKWFWPSVSVTVAELDGAEGFTKQPQAYMLHAAPRMTASVPVEFIPKRRGLHLLDRFQISTSFPFGFIRRALVDRHTDSILVHPPLAQVDRKLLALCRAAEKTGPNLRPQRGGDDEFYGVKEHRPGDNPRRIYWRRSARSSARGVLVAREMTQVAPPRLLLLVDTFVGGRSVAEHMKVERAIAMAASVAATALDDGLSVGLVVWSGTWTGIEPIRGKRHRDDLLSILARLPLNVDHDAAELLQRCGEYMKSGTTALLMSAATAPVMPGPRLRDSLQVIAAGSPQANAWFHFDPAVDFATCMPPDQQPPSADGNPKRRRGQGQIAPVISPVPTPRDARPTPGRRSQPRRAAAGADAK